MSFQKNKKIYKSFIFTLSAILALSLILPVFPTKTNAATNNMNDEILLIKENKDEINELAKDMEFLFTHGTKLKNGKYVINENVIINKFGKESLPSITAFIKMVNNEELKTNDLKGVPDTTVKTPKGVMKMAKKQSWKQCVGDKIIDATGIGFITGGLWKLIEREAWKQVAIELAKIAGKNAIKGGIIGLTASLVWFGIKCK